MGSSPISCTEDRARAAVSRELVWPVERERQPDTARLAWRTGLHGAAAENRFYAFAEVGVREELDPGWLGLRGANPLRRLSHVLLPSRFAFGQNRLPGAESCGAPREPA